MKREIPARRAEAVARPGDQFEVKVDEFVVDIVRDDLLIEIQTRNLVAIRRKLHTLLVHHPVRLVYPIAHPLEER